MNLTNEQIGQRIKAVRSEKNLTQTQLAQLLGKSLRTVQTRLKGGMPEEFSRFLEARTGLSIVRIS